MLRLLNCGNKPVKQIGALQRTTQFDETNLKEMMTTRQNDVLRNRNRMEGAETFQSHRPLSQLHRNLHFWRSTATHNLAVECGHDCDSLCVHVHAY